MYLNDNGEFANSIVTVNNQLLCYNSTNKSWTNPQCFGAEPSPRANHSTTVIKDKVWLFGGVDSNLTALQDIFELDMISQIWTEILPDQPGLQGRFCSSLNAISDTQLVLHGGLASMDVVLDDTWFMDLQTLTWRKHTTSKDYPRYGHTGSFVGNGCVIIIGGRTSVGHACSVFHVRTEPKTLHHLAMQTIHKQNITVGTNPALRPDLLDTRQSFPFALAVHCGSLNICKALLAHGVDPNVSFRFDVQGQRPQLSYIIRNPLELAAHLGHQHIMQLLLNEGAGFTSAESILKIIFAQNRAQILEYILDLVYNQLSKIRLWTCDYIKDALYVEAFSCVEILLCWGFYKSHKGELLELELQEFLDEPEELELEESSVFECAAVRANVKTMRMIVELNPQCLQEDWLVNGDDFTLNELEECKLFKTQILESRKQPSRLDILCRAIIIQHLGYNPLPEVEKLPLPKFLKNFVQLKHVEGF